MMMHQSIFQLTSKWMLFHWALTKTLTNTLALTHLHPMPLNHSSHSTDFDFDFDLIDTIDSGLEFAHSRAQKLRNSSACAKGSR